MANATAKSELLNPDTAELIAGFIDLGVESYKNAQSTDGRQLTAIDKATAAVGSRAAKTLLAHADAT